MIACLQEGPSGSYLWRFMFFHSLPVLNRTDPRGGGKVLKEMWGPLCVLRPFALEEASQSHHAALWKGSGSRELRPPANRQQQHAIHMHEAYERGFSSPRQPPDVCTLSQHLNDNLMIDLELDLPT